MCPGYYGPDSISATGGLTPRLYYGVNAPYYQTSSSIGYDPMNLVYGPMSLGGSIYGDSTIDWVTGSSMGYGMGYGVPGGYMAGGAYNPDAMFDYMDKWTDYMYDRNVKYVEKGRANQMKINGATDAAKYAADALTEKIYKNNQEHILLAFNNYKAAVRNIYPNGANLSDKELSAKAMDLYQQRTGVSLKDLIREKSNSVISQGYMNGLTLGFGWKGSAEETISKMSGLPMDREDKVKHAIGQGAGVGTSVGVGLIAGKTIFEKFGWIAKGCKSAPALAVAAVAAIGTAIYSFFNKD